MAELTNVAIKEMRSDISNVTHLTDSHFIVIK